MPVTSPTAQTFSVPTTRQRSSTLIASPGWTSSRSASRPKPGGTGPASRGQDHPVGIDGITTDEGQAGASSGALRRRHLLAEQHPDTDSAEPLGDRLRRLWLLSTVEAWSAPALRP